MRSQPRFRPITLGVISLGLLLTPVVAAEPTTAAPSALPQPAGVDGKMPYSYAQSYMNDTGWIESKPKVNRTRAAEKELK